jgi:hypothetical protein
MHCRSHNTWSMLIPGYGICGLGDIHFLFIPKANFVGTRKLVTLFSV